MSSWNYGVVRGLSGLCIFDARGLDRLWCIVTALPDHGDAHRSGRLSVLYLVLKVTGAALDECDVTVE